MRAWSLLAAIAFSVTACSNANSMAPTPFVKGGAKLDHDGGGKLDHLTAGRSV